MHTVIPPISPDPRRLHAFVEYLHGVRESDRTHLARELHDDVGTMLVAAAMELGWVESRSKVPELNERLRRLGSHLADVIKINRKSIESLRPTLLEEFGLFEALRWFFKHACHETPAAVSIKLPNSESRLDGSMLTHLFRATQTLTECTLQEGGLKRVDLEAVIVADTLTIRVAHQHVAAEPGGTLERFHQQLTSASHRIAALGGELVFDSFDGGGSYTIHVPLFGDTQHAQS